MNFAQFNKQILLIISVLALLTMISACNMATHKKSNPMDTDKKISLSETEWKNRLTEEQYNVLRLKATEKPFTGMYYKLNDHGIYCCAGCGIELFSSDTKFDAGCGWPSFYEAIADKKIETRTDTSLQMVRTEILCAACGGHLGHLFDDGPEPTGKRYCVNSAALNFKKL